MEHSEYIVGGWPRQILGAIRPVAIAGEPGEMLFFCQASNERFPIGQILRNMNKTTSIGEAVKTFGTEF